MNAPHGTSRNLVHVSLPDDLFQFLLSESKRVNLSKSYLMQLALKALRDLKTDD